MNRDTIELIFLQNGFTLKDGNDDLKPYVYQAAEALLLEYESFELIHLAGLAKSYLAATEAHISDTAFDMDGWLSSTNAELSVAVYDILKV